MGREGSVIGRVAATKRLAAPRSLKATSVGTGGITLHWSAPKGGKPAHYLILRDGKSLGKTSRTSYTDSKVTPGRTYRYTVRAVDKDKRAGALSQSVRVTVPNPTTQKLPSAPTTNTIGQLATVAPTPAGTPQPEPAPTPNPTSTPTPEPTATPSPTSTPTPSPTPTSTPTPTPSPTSTPTPTPSPTSTPSPTPTPTPT